MTHILLTSVGPSQCGGGTADPTVASAQGPAVLFATRSADADAANAATAEAPLIQDMAAVLANRPIAYREAGADWHELGYEAADHWTQMTRELRGRLGDDPMAMFDVAEFKVATNGGSASIITNNWVYSGSPRSYRVAGELREFVTVLGELTRSCTHDW